MYVNTLGNSTQLHVFWHSQAWEWVHSNRDSVYMYLLVLNWLRVNQPEAVYMKCVRQFYDKKTVNNQCFPSIVWPAWDHLYQMWHNTLCHGTRAFVCVCACQNIGGHYEGVNARHLLVDKCSEVTPGQMWVEHTFSRHALCIKGGIRHRQRGI